MLALYQGRASNKFGLLTGSIVSVDSTNLAVLGAWSRRRARPCSPCVYRPLLFASTDPDVAVARGVPVRLLSLVFAVLIALTTALAVPIVGAMMVLAVMIAPGRGGGAGDGEPGAGHACWPCCSPSSRCSAARCCRWRRGCPCPGTSRRSRSSATSAAAWWRGPRSLRHLDPLIGTNGTFARYASEMPFVPLLTARTGAILVAAARRRCRATSASTTPAATEALSDSTGPPSGSTR